MLDAKKQCIPPFEDHQCPASYCLHTLELLFHEPFLGDRCWAAKPQSPKSSPRIKQLLSFRGTSTVPNLLLAEKRRGGPWRMKSR